MARMLIIPRNHSGGNNDVFVGMRFVSTNSKPSVNAVFPLGYHYSVEDQSALRRELYSLLKMIKSYSKNDSGNLEGMRVKQSEFPFDAYITIIKAYMKYGYYSESESRFQRAPLGKVNWKRTIASVKPVIQNNSPVYTDFIIRENKIRTDKLISLIHEWCVYEAFEKLGWLITDYNPRKPVLRINDENKHSFVSVILKSLSLTFNDKNKQLFNAMISMLTYKKSEELGTFFYGTTHFHTVWEKLIDLAYGIPENEKRAFLPSAVWRFVFSDTPKTNSLYPDTIMRLNEDSRVVYILDAKYYSFMRNKANVPAASDASKQVIYGAYAAQNPSIDTVFNAFMMPYDFECDPYNLDTKGKEYAYIGYAMLVNSGRNKPYDKVLGILVDTKWLMEREGRVSKTKLAQFIRYHSIT